MWSQILDSREKTTTIWSQWRRQADSTHNVQRQIRTNTQHFNISTQHSHNYSNSLPTPNSLQSLTLKTSITQSQHIITTHNSINSIKSTQYFNHTVLMSTPCTHFTASAQCTTLQIQPEDSHNDFKYTLDDDQIKSTQQPPPNNENQSTATTTTTTTTRHTHYTSLPEATT